MKKNPLFYNDSNANKSKIAFAKRKLFLSISLVLFILGFSALSISAIPTTSGKSKASVCVLLPFAVGVKGTLAVNGADETDEQFKARGDKAESDVAYSQRCMKFLIDDAIGKANEETKKKFDELNTKLEAVKTQDELKVVKDEMIKHGLLFQSLKDSKVNHDNSIAKGTIAETLALNKSKIDSFLSTKTGKLEIEHKSHISQTSTDITSRGDTYFDMHEGGRIGQIPVRKPFLRQLFRNVNSASEFIKYVDQDTVVRAAANVALCAASNSTTKVTFKPYSIQQSKIRDYSDICLDMMNDYAFVEGEIRNLITSSVALKIDDQLLVGTGTHPELNSLTLAASTWAPNISGTKDWTGQIVTPNLINLIAVSRSQIQQLGQMNAWQPNCVLVNPGDYEGMMHLKNSFGDAVKAYPGMFVDNAGNIYINGMLVLSNPNITVDTYWIGDFTKGTVYAKPGIGIEMSYENATNFETETVTVKAYERLNLLIRNVDKNAFMNIPSIAAALALIAKP